MRLSKVRETQRIDDNSIQKKRKHSFLDLLSPNRDARLFEIVSFAILKFFYHDQTVYFGFD